MSCSSQNTYSTVAAATSFPYAYEYLLLRGRQAFVESKKGRSREILVGHSDVLQKSTRKTEIQADAKAA